MRKFSQLVVDSFVGELTYEGAAIMEELYMGLEPHINLDIARILDLLAENGHETSRESIRRMIENNLIEAEKLGNTWVIAASQLPIIVENIRPKGRPPKEKEV